MVMSEENDSFTLFMQQNQESKSNDNSSKCSTKDSKQKTALEIKEEEDKKELEEVKKESKHNASKYATAQANLMMAETKRFIMFLPFIICGILLFLVVITKGGSWIQTATQYGMSKIRGE